MVQRVAIHTDVQKLTVSFLEVEKPIIIKDLFKICIVVSVVLTRIGKSAKTTTARHINLTR